MKYCRSITVFMLAVLGLLVPGIVRAQALSYRLVAASASDSFSQVRIDEVGNVFYVRTAGGVWGIEKEGEDLGTVGGAAPWDASLTLTYILPTAARSGRVFTFGRATGTGIDSSNDDFTWLSHGLAPQIVTQEGTTSAPGTDPGVMFTGPWLSSMRQWGGGRIAMAAGLTGPGVNCTTLDPARNCDGIWAGTSGSLSLRVRAGQIAPGFPAGHVIHEFLAGDGGGNNNAPVNGSGTIAFLSRVLDSGGTTVRAVYRSPNQGNVSLVAKNGDPAPGGGVFNTLKAPTLSRHGVIMFNDVNGIYATEGAGLRVVAKVGQPAPGGSIYWVVGWPALAGYFTAFKADTTAALGERIFLQKGIGPIVPLVSEGDTAPGTAGTFERFRTNALVNSCGQVAFYGDLNTVGSVTANNDEGIWIYDALGVGLLVAREGDPGDTFGYPFTTITELNLIGVGSISQRAGLDDGGLIVLNDRSELAFSVELSDGTELVMVAYAGPQCEFVFADGFESGNTTAWSSTVG